MFIRPFDLGAIVWVDASWHVLDPVSAAVLSAVDGQVRVDELIEDAMAVGVQRSLAESIVLSALAHLQHAGLVAVGVDLSLLDAHGSEQPGDAEELDQAPTEVGRWTERDPDTNEMIEIVVEPNAHGHLQRTERWPDGRGRVTTWVSVTSSGATGDQGIEGVSLADVIPVDSCLGRKLRLGDAADLISIQLANGRLATVRSTDRAAVDHLLTQIPPRFLVEGRESPTVAFVVSPLEGVGPSRVFDRHGQRVGRPRRPEDIAVILESLIADYSRAASDGFEDLMILPAVTALHNTGCVALLPLRLAADGARLRAATSSGWTVHMARARIHPDGSIELPTAWSPTVTVRPSDISMYFTTEHGERGRLVDLLPEGVVDLADVESALDRVEALLRSAEHLPEHDFGHSS